MSSGGSASSEPGREIGLDALRAFAILSVLAFHSLDCISKTPEWCAAIFRRGWVGVDLFFVLSGFLISRQTFRADAQGTSVAASLRFFWMRRWFRTLPLYFVVLFVYALVKPAVFHTPFRGDPLRFAFFLQTYAPLNDFIQSWSLCVEEHFYLAFPLLVFVVPRRSPSGDRLARAARARHRLSCLALEHAPRLRPRDRRPIPLLADARSPRRHRDRSFPRQERAVWTAWSPERRRLLGMFGACFVCGYLAWSPAWILGSATHGKFGPLLLGAGFACLLVGMKGRTVPRWAVSPVERMAVYSYGAYLWHGLLVRVGSRAFESPSLPWWAAFIAFVAISFAVAVVTFHLVEQPFLWLRDRLLGIVPQAKKRVETALAAAGAPPTGSA